MFLTLCDSEGLLSIQAAYIVSLDSGVHLVVLLLLPGLNSLLMSRLSITSRVRDWWLAFSSVILALVGLAGMAFSPTSASMTFSKIFSATKKGTTNYLR